MENVSLPEELQKILDQKIGMGMVGPDMGKFMQYQTAQSMPELAKGAGSGGVAGDAMGLGAGVALGQVMAQNLQPGPARRNRRRQAGRCDGHAGEGSVSFKAKGVPHRRKVQSQEGRVVEKAHLTPLATAWR